MRLKILSIVVLLLTATSPGVGGPVSRIYGDPGSSIRDWLVSQTVQSVDPMPRSLVPDPALTWLDRQPVARWFGEWTGNPRIEAEAMARAAASSDSIPIWVFYRPRFHSCADTLSEEQARGEEYLRQVGELAEAAGSRPAWIVLEPDLLPKLAQDSSCRDGAAGAEGTAEPSQFAAPTRVDAKFATLRQAVRALKRASRVTVFIDAGNPGWVPAEEMAVLLERAGIAEADGFSLNVSNFRATEECERYGAALSRRLGGKAFVIDTSRNGLGPAPEGEWCNPSGRAVGEPPRILADPASHHSSASAYLWIKVPGESDETCGGGPPAGEFWPEYARGLVMRSPFYLPSPVPAASPSPEPPPASAPSVIPATEGA